MADVSSFILHVRSKDADNYPSGEDLRTEFDLQLLTPVYCFDNEYMQLEVASMEVPFSFYGTNTNNNVLQVRESQTAPPFVWNTDLDIPQGNYSIEQLLSQITAQMNGATNLAATYSWTYDIITNKCTVATNIAAAVGTCTFLFNTGSEANNLATPNGRSIAKQLGWTGDSDILFDSATAALTRTSNSRVDLVTIHSLYLRSNLAVGNTIASDTGSNSTILCKVPIDVNPLEMIYFSNEAFGAAKNMLKERDIKYMSFRLTDQNNNTINLGDEINFEFTLIFTIYPLTYRQNIIRERIQFNKNVEVDEEEIEKPPRLVTHEILSHPLLNEHKEIINTQKEKDEQFNQTLNEYQKTLSDI